MPLLQRKRFLNLNHAGVFAPAGGGTPSNPSAILGSSLLAWYDPTRNFDGTAWNDQSGNGYNLASTGSPTYSATAFNGRPGVTLNGTSQYYKTSSQVIATGSATSMAFWLVFNPTASPSAYGRFLTTVDAGASRLDYQGVGGAVAFARDNGNNAMAAIADPTVISLGTFAYSYGTNYIASMIFDGANTISYLANVQQTSTSNTRPATWGASGGVVGLSIGNTLNTNGAGTMTFGTDYGKGVIAEVVVAKGTITSQQRTDMQAWLAYNNGL